MSDNSKIALSFDVEDWYHTPAITGSSFAKYKTVEDFFLNWKGEYDCLSDGFNYLINTLDKYNVKATFFIVADVIERYPAIVDSLKKSNHEIQCHSLHHTSAIDSKTKEPFQPIEQWEMELINAKKLIEKEFNIKVTGYRAPGAYFGKWMVNILEKNGFLYDSSIAYNSIYNKTDVKLTNIPTTPYLMNSVNLSNVNPNSKLIQLPWSYFKLGNFILPGGGAFFYRSLGNLYFNKVIQQCLKKGDTMFYMHPIDFSNIPIPLSNNKSRPSYWINKGNNTRIKFESFLIKYKDRLATCGEVIDRFNTNR